MTHESLFRLAFLSTTSLGSSDTGRSQELLTTPKLPGTARTGRLFSVGIASTSALHSRIPLLHSRYAKMSREVSA